MADADGVRDLKSDEERQHINVSGDIRPDNRFTLLMTYLGWKELTGQFSVFFLFVFFDTNLLQFVSKHGHGTTEGSYLSFFCYTDCFMMTLLFIKPQTRQD